ncbi:MAG TPA: 4'-phosphopantetheinyl transferase superfamily protein [Candidatus Nanopelagicales bacterium]
MQWSASGERQVPAGDAWLTPFEAVRAGGMRFTKRRTEYRLRRFAGKRAVAAVLGMPDHDPHALARIAVLNRRTGAPFVQVDGTDLSLDVSLTDRAGWAVCLVGPDLGAVGCDLEMVEARSEGFVSDFLTPDEQSLVRDATGAGGDARDAAANLIWSAKESALKVLRTGLRADTRTVEVTFGGATPSTAAAGAWHQLAVATRLGELPGWWRRDGVFLLTVVAADPAALGAPPEVLPGSADLAVAEPLHSWLTNPLAE